MAAERRIPHGFPGRLVDPRAELSQLTDFSRTLSAIGELDHRITSSFGRFLETEAFKHCAHFLREDVLKGGLANGKREAYRGFLFEWLAFLEYSDSLELGRIVFSPWQTQEFFEYIFEGKKSPQMLNGLNGGIQGVYIPDCVLLQRINGVLQVSGILEATLGEPKVGKWSREGTGARRAITPELFLAGFV